MFWTTLMYIHVIGKLIKTKYGFSILMLTIIYTVNNLPELWSWQTCCFASASAWCWRRRPTDPEISFIIISKLNEFVQAEAIRQMRKQFLFFYNELAEKDKWNLYLDLLHFGVVNFQMIGKIKHHDKRQRTLKRNLGIIATKHNK